MSALLTDLQLPIAVQSRGSKTTQELEESSGRRETRVLRDCMPYFPNETALSYSLPYSITSYLSE